MKAFSGRKVKWWEAALFFVAVNGVARLLSIPDKKSQSNYRNKSNPKWSPPAALFGPVWIINNIIQISGTVKLINSTTDFPDKEKFMAVQALMWLDYVTYPLVGLKYNSTILSAIWTNSFTALAAYSMIKAFQHDKQVALSFLSLTLWGVYASSLANYELVFNDDPLFKTQRLLAPPESGILEQK